MMTGEDYKKSLFDGRATYFEGERIEDLPGHRLLGLAPRIVTRRHHDLDRAKQIALKASGLSNSDGTH
jgi:hypothetical protein